MHVGDVTQGGALGLALASQARHELVSPYEMFASRIVVPGLLSHYPFGVLDFQGAEYGDRSGIMQPLSGLCEISGCLTQGRNAAPFPRVSTLD